MPEAVEVREGPTGLGMYATRSFAAGEKLYESYRLQVPVDAAAFELIISNRQQRFRCDTAKHGVRCSPTARWLYFFDAFLNHSCDPNMVDVIADERGIFFHAVALRPIAAGEEFRGDYHLFEYDATDKAIDSCSCGAAACIQQPIRGFKFLSCEQQDAILSRVENHVRAWHLAEQQRGAV